MFSALFEDTDGMSQYKNEFFAYVEPLVPAPGTVKEGVHVPDKGVGLFHVRRSYAPDNSRNGIIVKLTDIWRPIDLVPKFGSKCVRKWDATLTCEVVTEFFVNHFFDKEIFNIFTFH